MCMGACMMDSPLICVYASANESLCMDDTMLFGDAPFLKYDVIPCLSNGALQKVVSEHS